MMKNIFKKPLCISLVLLLGFPCPMLAQSPNSIQRSNLSFFQGEGNIQLKPHLNALEKEIHRLNAQIKGLFKTSSVPEAAPELVDAKQKQDKISQQVQESPAAQQVRRYYHREARYEPPQIVTSKKLIKQWKKIDNSDKKDVADAIWDIYTNWFQEGNILNGIKHYKGGSLGHKHFSHAHSLFFIFNPHVNTIYLLGIGFAAKRGKGDFFYDIGTREAAQTANYVDSFQGKLGAIESLIDTAGFQNEFSSRLVPLPSHVISDTRDSKISLGELVQWVQSHEEDSAARESDALSSLQKIRLAQHVAAEAVDEFLGILWNEVDPDDQEAELREHVLKSVETSFNGTQGALEPFIVENIEPIIVKAITKQRRKESEREGKQFNRGADTFQFDTPTRDQQGWHEELENLEHETIKQLAIVNIWSEILLSHPNEGRILEHMARWKEKDSARDNFHQDGDESSFLQARREINDIQSLISSPLDIIEKNKEKVQREFTDRLNYLTGQVDGLSLPENKISLKRILIQVTQRVERLHEIDILETFILETESLSDILDSFDELIYINEELLRLKTAWGELGLDNFESTREYRQIVNTLENIEKEEDLILLIQKALLYLKRLQDREHKEHQFLQLSKSQSIDDAMNFIKENVLEPLDQAASMLLDTIDDDEIARLRRGWKFLEKTMTPTLVKSIARQKLLDNMPRADPSFNFARTLKIRQANALRETRKNLHTSQKSQEVGRLLKKTKSSLTEELSKLRDNIRGQLERFQELNKSEEHASNVAQQDRVIKTILQLMQNYESLIGDLIAIGHGIRLFLSDGHDNSAGQYMHHISPTTYAAFSPRIWHAPANARRERIDARQPLFNQKLRGRRESHAEEIISAVNEAHEHLMTKPEELLQLKKNLLESYYILAVTGVYFHVGDSGKNILSLHKEEVEVVLEWLKKNKERDEKEFIVFSPELAEQIKSLRVPFVSLIERNENERMNKLESLIRSYKRAFFNQHMGSHPFNKKEYTYLSDAVEKLASNGVDIKAEVLELQDIKSDGVLALSDVPKILQRLYEQLASNFEEAFADKVWFVYQNELVELRDFKTPETQERIRELSNDMFVRVEMRGEDVFLEIVSQQNLNGTPLNTFEPFDPILAKPIYQSA